LARAGANARFIENEENTEENQGLFNDLLADDENTLFV
jgi:hypothetical protein